MLGVGRIGGLGLASRRGAGGGAGVPANALTWNGEPILWNGETLTWSAA